MSVIIGENEEIFGKKNLFDRIQEEEKGLLDNDQYNYYEKKVFKIFGLYHENPMEKQIL